MKRRLLLFVLCLAGPGLSTVPAEPGVPAGRLVIVGGGLRAGNASVHRALIDGLGATGELGIIPLASGKPVATAGQFRADLVRHGLAEARLHLLPLACIDDPTTADVDEGAWAAHADQPELAARIRRLAGLWFTGGDQSRITRTLLRPDGEPTTALVAIREVLARGGVIGGTSAGAAMQSTTMILGGTSPEALTRAPQFDYPGMTAQETGPLILGRGLGLFPHGLIDQHFDRKSRLGRLLAALAVGPPSDRLGFGIDEDTALVYEAATATATVVGSGTVTVVDARAARTERHATTGVRLSLLSPGDRITLPDLSVQVDERRQRIADPYWSIPTTEVSSLLTPYGGRLEDALGFLLVDNRAGRTLTTRVRNAGGDTAELVFTADEPTVGYWGYADGQRDSYSVLNVEVTCRPGLPGAANASAAPPP